MNINHATAAPSPQGFTITSGAPLACACGSADLIAIAPGQDDEACDLLGTRMVTKRGVDLRCWCEACWIGKAQAAA